MSSYRLLPLALLSLWGCAEASTLYKCSNTEGVVLYTNQKPNKGKACTILSQTQDRAPATKSGGKSRKAATPTPGDFPRVSSNEQKARDGDRRTILEQELATEQKNLDAAKKAGDTAKAQLHERNIDALRKEIARVK